MFVNVSGSSASVLEPEDVKSLSVRVHGGADLASAITPIGRVDVDDEHVWLSIDALRAAASESIDADRRREWIDGFESMVAYAVSKGWASTDGRALRAHIERV